MISILLKHSDIAQPLLISTVFKLHSHLGNRIDIAVNVLSMEPGAIKLSWGAMLRASR